MPTIKIYHLDVDSSYPEFPKLDVEVVQVDSLGLSSEIINKLTSSLNVIEYSTALKPVFLKHILDLGSQACIYLDPDIYVLGNLEELFDLCLKYEAVVTPHRLTPGNLEFEKLLLNVGTFNLGFIGVSSHSSKFLDWWMSRTLLSTTINWYSGIFTDQKWINHIPAYFRAHVLKNPECNVAPWNINERDLTEMAAQLSRDNLFPFFIHFSQNSHLQYLSDSLLLEIQDQFTARNLALLKQYASKYNSLMQSAISNVSFNKQKKRNFKKIRLRVNSVNGLLQGVKDDWGILKKYFSQYHW